MSDVLAIIPARAGSKGIPNKNFKPLAGISPMNRAIRVCHELRGVVRDFVVTSDMDWESNARYFADEPGWQYGRFLYAPAPLHTDDCPMIDVVKDVLARVPGSDDQIVVLLQPTQPLRKPEHVTAAINLLRDKGAGTVMSVVQLESIDKLLMYTDWDRGALTSCGSAAERRQHARPTFKRDGTVYAWRRGEGYMPHPWWPMIMDPDDTCALDEPRDWDEAERRLETLAHR